MYKYLPYALGLQTYVLELPAGICMLSAQRLLSAPPFVVVFPCKANKRKYEVTLTGVFEQNSCIIIVVILADFASLIGHVFPLPRHNKYVY